MDLLELRGYDFGPFREFRLPLYKQGLVWIGGENHDSEGADSNGGGKTSLFRALTWVLWGKTVDGDDTDAVIHEGADRARVELAMREKDERYLIVRERKKGAPKLSLLYSGVAGEEPVEVTGSKQELQDLINDFVGLNFVSFCNTVLYGQNDTARFADPSTTDAQRKEMCYRLMGTEVLGECLDKVKDAAKGRRDKVKELEGDKSKIEFALGELDTGGASARFDEWEQERNKTVNRLVREARTYKEKAEQVEVGLDDPEKLRATLDTIEVNRKILDRKVVTGEQALAEIEALRAKIDPLKGKYSRLDARLDGVVSERQHLIGEACPVCKGSLKSKAATAYRKSLKVDAFALQAEVKKIGAMIDRAEKAVRQARKINAAGVQAGRDRLDDMQTEAGIKDRLAVVEQAEERAERHLKIARSIAKQAKEERVKPNPHHGAMAELANQRKKLQTQKKGIAGELTVEAGELAHLEFWVRGFGGQGLPSYMLDSAMPYITKQSNYYLETLADGDITMHFSTQSELKGGGVRDKIGIEREVEGREGYPPSGGQLKKMAIATDLAFMDLACSREGSTVPDMLALDEVLDGLDAEGRQRVLRLLHDLRSKRGTIFVISHGTDMSEIFERSFIVRKKDGVATLDLGTADG